MPFVSVLPICDKIVGPHLELIRRLCDPSSRSRPHITVRFFARLSIPPGHLSTRIESFDLLEPGMFDAKEVGKPSQQTVFLNCASEELLRLEHKPHFPATGFHVTLYDGEDKRFGRKLLKVLREFRWKIRVPLPSDTTLIRVELRSRRIRKVVPLKQRFSNENARLMRAATSESLKLGDVVTLTQVRRLQLVRQVCRHLERATQEFRIAPGDVGRTEDLRETVFQGEQRATPAVHLTPPELALAIAQYAVALLDPPRKQIHFGDPAAGTGAFYNALLQVVPRDQILSAIGLDEEVAQIQAANARWSRRGMQVVTADYLHLDEHSPRNLILANPPYLRHQDIDSCYKQQLRSSAASVLGASVSALSGRFVYWMLLCHRWMAPSAIAAWLVPSEFMQTSYGAALRDYLTRRVQLIRVHQFGLNEPQFEHANVSPCLVVFRNRQPSNRDLVRLTAAGTLAVPLQEQLVPMQLLSSALRWRIPLREDSRALLGNPRIGDLFDVHRGIATGANSYFVLERKNAAALGIPTEALRPVLPKSRKIAQNVIEREPDGYPNLPRQLALLDCNLSERAIRVRFPQLKKYLDLAKGLRIRDRRLVRDRDPWYRQEQRKPPLFLCTYMGRSTGKDSPVRFIWNKSDAIALNTYLLLYPKPRFDRLIRSRVAFQAELFAILQQSAQGSLQQHLRSQAGGLQKIEPSELMQVRLAATPMWLPWPEKTLFD